MGAPGEPIEPIEPDVMAHARPFSGTPQRYLKIAILMSLGIHLYLYLGMLFLHGYLGGAAWMFGWKPAALAATSALVFARYAYRWIMRLDAQYGSGSGWSLPSRTVKLPEPRRRH